VSSRNQPWNPRPLPGLTPSRGRFAPRGPEVAGGVEEVPARRAVDPAEEGGRRRGGRKRATNAVGRRLSAEGNSPIRCAFSLRPSAYGLVSSRHKHRSWSFPRAQRAVQGSVENGQRFAGLGAGVLGDGPPSCHHLWSTSNSQISGGRGMPRIRQIPRIVPSLILECRRTGTWVTFDGFHQMSGLPQ
jgi:hypothetical protein